MVAFFGTCNAGFLPVACADDFCYFYGVCSNKSPLKRGISQEQFFFFSLLKRNKEAKKEKLSPTLVSHGNASHERQRYFRYAQHKSPGGGNRRLVRRNTALFSPLYRGVRFSGEHAVLSPKIVSIKYDSDKNMHDIDIISLAFGLIL